MKITLEIDAELDDVETLVRMILMGQITDAELSKAKQRESTYKTAVINAKASQLFLKAHDEQRRKPVEIEKDQAPK